MDRYLDALANGDFASGLAVLFALLIAHALCDHPLQGEFLALHKNRHHRGEGNESGAKIWPWCLSAHALIHAGGVWVVTGSAVFAVIEFGLHGLIDFLKSEDVTNFHADQLLHLLCKVGYVLAIALV